MERLWRPSAEDTREFEVIMDTFTATMDALRPHLRRMMRRIIPLDGAAGCWEAAGAGHRARAGAPGAAIGIDLRVPGANLALARCLATVMKAPRGVHAAVEDAEGLAAAAH